MFLRAALTYAGRGWYVFPLWPRKKVPLGGEGVLDATTDEAQIREWWAKTPDANIGLATGRSKLAVIDCDGEEGLRSLSAWEQANGRLPATVTAHTPSGGMHLLFAYDSDELAPGTDVLGKGSKVDLRVGNSYIVVAPSIHPNGGRYVWDQDAHPARTKPAALPDELGTAIRDRRATPERAAPDDEPELVEDGQDEYGARKAAKLAATGFSKDEARATLKAMIETRFAGGWQGLDPRRPWTAKDVERWLKGAFEKFYDPDGGQTEAERIKDLVGDAGQAVAAPQPTQGAMTPVEGFSAAELQGQEFSPIKWVITDVLPEGASILGGKPKVGKSWLTLGIAAAVASATDYAFGELTVERGDVLYLALEDGKRRLQRRLRKMLGTNKRWPRGLTFFTEWPRVNDGGIEAIEKWLDDHPAAQLVVIDTLKHIEPADLTKGTGGYRADYQSITPLQHLAQRRGIAILIVTHLRKMGSEDPIDMLQGTLGLSGGIDNFYVFTRPKNSLKGTLYYKGRDVDEGELALVWREGDSMLWRVDNEEEPPRPGDTVLGAIKPGESVAPSDLADRIGLPADTVRKRLERLAETGQVVKLRKGIYCLPATSITDF